MRRLFVINIEWGRLKNFCRYRFAVLCYRFFSPGFQSVIYILQQIGRKKTESNRFSFIFTLQPLQNFLIVWYCVCNTSQQFLMFKKFLLDTQFFNTYNLFILAAVHQFVFAINELFIFLSWRPVSCFYALIHPGDLHMYASTWTQCICCRYAIAQHYFCANFTFYAINFIISNIFK